MKRSNPVTVRFPPFIPSLHVRNGGKTRRTARLFSGLQGDVGLPWRLWQRCAIIQIRQRPLAKGAFGALTCGSGPQRGDGLSHPALQRLYSALVPPVYPSGPNIAPPFRGYSWAARVIPSRNTDQSEGKIDPQRVRATGVVLACAACRTRSHNAPVNIGGQPDAGRETPVGGVGSSKAEQSGRFGLPQIG